MKSYRICRQSCGWKRDVDANQEFAAKYGVRNIPTVLVLKDGEVVGRQVGVATKASYAESIDALL